MDLSLSLIVPAWLLLFLIKVVFQFLLAQKLRHQQPWFAFVPILNQIQWLQIGHVSGWNLCWVFLPIVGIFVYIYKWFIATIKICERAGERGSFCVLFFVPLINIGATIRLAFKTGFWVKSSTEEKLINQVRNGLKSGHSPAELKDFALNHGIALADFQSALDKTRTIEKNGLKLSSKQYDVPVFVNIVVAVLWVFGSFILLFYTVTVGVAGLLGDMADGFRIGSEKINNSIVEERTRVAAEQLENYLFLMAISGAEKLENSDAYRLTGTILKGRLGDTEKIYLLDETLALIDLVNREGHALTGNQGYISIPDRTDTNRIAYLAISEPLGALNADWNRGSSFEVPNEPVLVMDRILETSETLKEFRGEFTVKSATLSADDNLYAYDENLVLVDAAKIKKVTLLEEAAETPLQTVLPGSRILMDLELARGNSEAIKYLTPFKEVEHLEEFAELKNNK